MEIKPQSFFNIFSFFNCEHDAADGIICYDGIEIERDLRFEWKSEHNSFKYARLIKGTKFESVRFHLGMDENVARLQFIDWVPGDVYTPNKNTFIEIPLTVIAPYLKY